MKRHLSAGSVILSGLAIFFSLNAAPVAAPRVIEESSTFTIPPAPVDSSLFSCSAMAIDADRLVCLYRGRLTGGGLEQLQLFLYERETSGAWVLREQLLDTYARFVMGPASVALEGNLVALALEDTTHVYERTASGWVYTPLNKPGSVASFSRSVAISSGQIVVGAISDRYQAVVFRKNSAGSWQSSVLSAGLVPPNSEGGPLVDISGATVALSAADYDPQTQASSSSVTVFTLASGVWSATKLQGAAAVSMDLSGDSLALFAYTRPYNLQLFRRSAGVWTEAARFQDPDLFSSPSRGLLVSGDLIAQEFTDDDPGFGGSIVIYQRTGTELKAVAELRTSRDLFRLQLVGFSGRSVIGSYGDLLYGRMVRFDIPLDLTQPAIIHDSFEDGNASGWTPSNINDWSIATAGGSRVYRQTGLSEGAYTLLGNASWSNQSIQAELTPTAISGSNRWAGLIVRFKDFNNYYYLALRSSNRIELRKKVNGGFVTLASKPFTFAVGRTYRARLEAIGSQLRAYVDGVSVIEAVDRSLTSGRSGLQTSAARADFDNIRVTPNPLRLLFADTFSDDRLDEWTKAAGDWLDPPPMHEDPEYPDPQAQLRYFWQRSTSGTGRAIAGIATDDMIVEAKARAVSAMTDGWFGVIARYVDAGNFYYLRMGKDSVSIRKMVDGRLVELARAPLAVTSNITYTLRLEVVGSNLRGYVNGRLYVEVNDTSYTSGRYGLGTNFTSVRFDDVNVRRP